MRLDQSDGIDINVMLARDGLANGGENLVGDPALAKSLGLLHDDQPFHSAGLDGKCSPRARTEQWVTPLGRRFDILRIDILAMKNDHILETARDEQNALAEEAEIAGGEELRCLVAGQASFEGFLRFLGPFPVPLGDAGTGDPDLPNLVVEARRSGLGIGDHHNLAGRWSAAAGERLARTAGRRFGDLSLGQGAGI